MADGIRKRKLYLFPYLCIAPFFLVFILFNAIPTIFTFFISFFDWNGFDLMKSIGFQNYIDLTNDSVFIKSVINTFKIMLITLPLEVGISIVIAVILDSVFTKTKQYFETIFFLPYITSPVAIGILFSLIFSYKYGLFNSALKWIGIVQDDINWLGNAKYAIWVISIVYLWRAIGYTVVLFIAGLQTIPIELYESAKIDGARPTTTFFRITLPLLKPVTVFVVITSIIGDLQIFAEPLMLFSGDGKSVGGTDNSAMTMMTYLYQNAFTFGRSGYGAAISYVLFFIILVFSLLMYRTMTGREDNE